MLKQSRGAMAAMIIMFALGCSNDDSSSGEVDQGQSFDQGVATWEDSSINPGNEAGNLDSDASVTPSKDSVTSLSDSTSTTQDGATGNANVGVVCNSDNSNCQPSPPNLCISISKRPHVCLEECQKIGDACSTLANIKAKHECFLTVTDNQNQKKFFCALICNDASECPGGGAEFDCLDFNQKKICQPKPKN